MSASLPDYVNNYTNSVIADCQLAIANLTNQVAIGMAIGNLISSNDSHPLF